MPDSTQVVSTVSRLSTEFPVMHQSQSETVTYTTKVLSTSSSQRTVSPRSSSFISTSSSGSSSKAERRSSSSSSASSVEASLPTGSMTHTVKKQFYLRKRTDEKHTTKTTKTVIMKTGGPEFMITEVGNYTGTIG